MYKLLPILLFAFGLAVTTEDIYDNSYALVIGIDKYDNVLNLDYAVKDAESVATLLKDNFNFPLENIKILLNDEATFTNVRRGLDEISASAKSNDRVLIYFAGHGKTMDLPDGGEMGYLLPVDGNQENLFSTSILMDDLKKISSMTRAKHMLFLIDACYGGLAATGSRGLSANTQNYIDKITNDKARQIITAGGKGEEVIEKSEWGHSAFTMNLMRALKNGKADLNDDGYITAEELGLFLKEKVTIDSENQQTPQSRRFTSQEGEFVFINNTFIEKQVINITPDNKIPKLTTFEFKDKDKELKIAIPITIQGDIGNLYEKIKGDIKLSLWNGWNDSNMVNEDLIQVSSNDIERAIINTSGYDHLIPMAVTIIVIIVILVLLGILLIHFQREKSN